MTLKSATVHPFLSASCNGRIASTHMTSDSPIFLTRLLQSKKIRPLSKVSQDYLETLYGGDRGDITRIQICTATHGRKCVRFAIGGVAYKSNGGNRPELPQSFELPSFAGERFTNTELARMYLIKVLTEANARAAERLL
ncbi:hypothetical protein TNCV_1443131 [Trichonephila clavipes]|nr:hypothetical protein TNCV_1443131 [Trichonephila clavipes]